VKTEKTDGAAAAIRALGNQKSDRRNNADGFYTGGDKEHEGSRGSSVSQPEQRRRPRGDSPRKETDKDLRLKIVRQLVDMAPRSKRPRTT